MSRGVPAPRAALIATERPQDAVPYLTRALDLQKHGDQHATLLAEARFALAQALWGVGTDRPRATLLATQARDSYVRVPDAKHAAEVETWLAARGRGRAPASGRMLPP